MISGRARIDLGDAAPERMGNRLAGIESMPSGAEVLVDVGVVAVEPEAIRLLRLHERRLRIVIEGAPFNVPRWLEAMRDGFGELIV